MDASGQVELKYRRVVDDRLERLVSRRHETRVSIERIVDQLGEPIKQLEKLFDVFLRVL